ncbi:hypothetical protein NKH93_03355 [Mesorhizobium sp. M0954]|uniref:hypothetical protein n=1 Tax=Mesorhizobium sp. M0954 TaxID=2957032 RepID=UPI00333681F9
MNGLREYAPDIDDLARFLEEPQDGKSLWSADRDSFHQSATDAATMQGWLDEKLLAKRMPSATCRQLTWRKGSSEASIACSWRLSCVRDVSESPSSFNPAGSIATELLRRYPTRPKFC